MAYSKINWKDYPEESTPLNALNLNKMDEQIKANADNLEGVAEDLTDINADLTEIKDNLSRVPVSNFGVLNLYSQSSDGYEGSQINFKGLGGNNGNDVNIDSYGNEFRIYSKFNDTENLHFFNINKDGVTFDGHPMVIKTKQITGHVDGNGNLYLFNSGYRQILFVEAGDGYCAIPFKLDYIYYAKIRHVGLNFDAVSDVDMTVLVAYIGADV